MALVIGDNSYATVAEADAYYLARGVTDWATLTTPQKESSLILGTDYLEATYSTAWQGRRTDPEQSLSWPRSDVFVEYYPIPSNTVPAAIIKAQIEMALRASAGEPLIQDQGQRVTEEKVDVLTVKYADFSDPALRYPYVNRLVMPYLASAVSDGSMQVARLVRT